MATCRIDYTRTAKSDLTPFSAYEVKQGTWRVVAVFGSGRTVMV
jgi:hypothetical protein